MNEYPLGTVEYVKFSELSMNGEIPAAFEVAITRKWDRPEEDDWDPGVVVEGEPKFLLDTNILEVGTYKVWVRFTDAPEKPLIEAGEFKIA